MAQEIITLTLPVTATKPGYIRIALPVENGWIKHIWVKEEAVTQPGL